MLHSRLRPHEGRTGGGDLRVVLTRHKTLTRARGEIDHQVHIARSNSLHDLFVVGKLHAGAPISMSDMNMHNGCAGAARIDASICDLLRSTWQARMLGERSDIASHGATENSGGAHWSEHCWKCVGTNRDEYVRRWISFGINRLHRQTRIPSHGRGSRCRRPEQSGTWQIGFLRCDGNASTLRV